MFSAAPQNFQNFQDLTGPSSGKHTKSGQNSGIRTPESGLCAPTFCSDSPNRPLALPKLFQNAPNSILEMPISPPFQKIDSKTRALVDMSHGLVVNMLIDLHVPVAECQGSLILPCVPHFQFGIVRSRIDNATLAIPDPSGLNTS
jgi:hypothetical protein